MVMPDPNPYFLNGVINSAREEHMSNNFGRLLRKFREENDFNQETLAKRLNVNQPTISDWENGKRWPEKSEIQAIIRQLGISAESSQRNRKDELSKDGSGRFGNWLRRARADKGWTQRELADKAALSSQTISLIENGVITSPQKATIKNLEEALGEKTISEKEKPQVIKDIGEYEEVDADSITSLPGRPGIYILNAVNEKRGKRPIYVGTTGNLQKRMNDYAHQKRGVWWFRKPLVGIVGYVEITNEALRKRVETILQKGLGSLLVFNDQGIDAEPD